MRRVLFYTWTNWGLGRWNHSLGVAEVQLAGTNQDPAQVHPTSASQVLVPVMCLMNIHRVFALRQQSIVVGFQRLESSPDFGPLLLVWFSASCNLSLSRTFLIYKLGRVIYSPSSTNFWYVLLGTLSYFIFKFLMEASEIYRKVHTHVKCSTQFLHGEHNHVIVTQLII